MSTRASLHPPSDSEVTVSQFPSRNRFSSTTLKLLIRKIIIFSFKYTIVRFFNYLSQQKYIQHSDEVLQMKCRCGEMIAARQMPHFMAFSLYSHSQTLLGTDDGVFSMLRNRTLVNINSDWRRQQRMMLNEESIITRNIDIWKILILLIS